MADGCKWNPTDRSGRRCTWMLPGRHIPSADGATGLSGAGLGSLTSLGDGCHIITAAGIITPESGGAGFQAPSSHLISGLRGWWFFTGARDGFPGGH
jgi:hypothetical protein